MVVDVVNVNVVDVICHLVKDFRFDHQLSVGVVTSLFGAQVEN